VKNVIFIEGLPGSGKTTFAQKINEILVKKGYKTKLFNEGDLHPIDLAWCSITTKEVFDKLISGYPDKLEEILSKTVVKNDKYITAYTKVRFDKKTDYYDVFSKYEIYREDDFELFKNAHMELWNEFSRTYDKESIYIFECIYLQNHINELMLKFDKSKEEIISYFNDLMDKLKDIDKTLIYLSQTDVDWALKNVTEDRRSTNPNYRDWIDLVIEYFEQTKHGKRLGYIGYEGALKYFKDRQVIELEVINQLDMDVKVFNLINDHDEMFYDVSDYLSKTYKKNEE